MKVGIITVSDKGSKGQREDASGPAIRKILDSKLKAEGFEYNIVPDEIEEIVRAIIDFTDNKACRLVLTTGGTGLSLRDVTPEATLMAVDRFIPGIPEAIRQASLTKTPFAMLSRLVAGTRGKSLIINLPGSPKAVRECLEVVLPVLEHALEVLDKGSLECGKSR